MTPYNFEYKKWAPVHIKFLIELILQFYNQTIDTIDLFKKLVSIPCPFPKEKEISDFIAQYLETTGFSVKKVPTEKTRRKRSGERHYKTF